MSKPFQNNRQMSPAVLKKRLIQLMICPISNQHSRESVMMLKKYIYKKHKIIRLIWILYSISFPFLAKYVFTSVSTYEFLADLCTLNLFLFVISLIYIVFCIRKKYYFDILITAITQIPLVLYSFPLLLALGILLGGQR